MSQRNSYNISHLFLKANQLLWRNSFLQRVRSAFFYIDKVLLVGCNNPKHEDNNKKKVLIIYNLALGDGVMFYGVSRSLRDIWPREEYEITVTCQKAFKQLYEGNDVYDHVLPLDFSGSVINPKKRREVFKELRSIHYDIVFDPVGTEDATTNVYVTRAVVGDTKIGVLDTTLKHQLSNKRRNMIYDQIIRINKENIHLIDYYAEAFRQLGATNCISEPANLPNTEIDLDLPDDYFIIFPVASMDVKKWDIKNYAYLAEKIQEKTNLPIVLCGTEHDRVSIEQMLSNTSDLKYIDVIGKTDIMEFTAVIGGASLVVTNDTSAYHIAVARGVTTFMICGGYTYNRYANYHYQDMGRKDPTLITHKMDCFNCSNHCKYKGYTVFPCIESISKEYAWEEISRRI